MEVSIKPSFYLDRLPLHFREAIRDTHWETMIPHEDATYVEPGTSLNPAGTYWATHFRQDDRIPKRGPLPERIDADFETQHPDSVYEAGLVALELAHIQLVSWGMPGLPVRFCVTVDDVVLREVRLTFWMQATNCRRRWDVMHLSNFDDKPPCDETVAIIYANASFEQSEWPEAAPSEDRLARIPDVLLVKARLSESFLKSYALNALANWEDVDVPAMSGTLFDRCVLGALGIEVR
jgi:hypothetical protein